MTGLILGALVLLLTLLTLFHAWRRPHLRRMAWRNVLVNKNTTMLTVLGAMIGTTLITSTMLLQHSMEQSRERVFLEQFGNVQTDMPAVGQPNLNGGFFQGKDIAEIQRIGRDGQAEMMKDSLPVVSHQTTIWKTDPSGKPLLINPNTNVQGFEQTLAMKFDQGAHLIPQDLAADEIVLTTPIAQRLEVQAGDTVMLKNRAQDTELFKVRAIVPELGLTGYRGTNKARSTAIVSLDAARKLAEVPEGQYTNVLLSGNARNKVFTFLQQFFPSKERSPFALLGFEGGWQEVGVRLEADRRLEQTLKFMPIFNIASINAVLIGMVLILNIFKMMAEERRQEIGILRATGMTRRDVGRVLRMEGLIYAVLSGLAGSLAGIGLSYLLLFQLRDTFSEMVEYSAEMVVRYSFSIDPSALLTGFSIGVLLVFLCVSRVARNASKIPIVEALQKTEGDNSHSSSSKRPVGRTAAGLFSAILAVGFLLITMTDLFHEKVSDLPAFPLLIFFSGFLLVLLWVFTFVSSMRVLPELVQWLLRGFPSTTGVLRLALRYPESNRTRSGLLVFMFAMVFFLTSFAGVFTASWTQFFGGFDAGKATGGYDLMATAGQRMITTEQLNDMLKSSPYVQQDAVEKATSVWQASVVYQQSTPHNMVRLQYDLNGIDSQFAEQTLLPMLERAPEYASDRAVWQALATDPSLIVISDRQNGLSDGKQRYEVGGTLEIPAESGSVKKRIIGIANYDNESYGYTTSYGYWINQQALQAIIPDPREIKSALLLGVKHEQRLAEVAKGIEKEFNLQAISPLVNPKQNFLVGTSFIRVFFTQFEGFSVLATGIGIVGLVIVMLRVIRERRQQFGMLRAIGIKPSTIYWSVLIEGAMISLVGITLGLLIGCYVGVLMTESLSASGAEATQTAIGIVFPYWRLGLYFTGAVLVTLLCVMIPARKALKLSPVEATRYVG